ncbi:MAG TPA: hypothetical protein VFE47_24625 [Tepidisphaeraceae bacterium]|jgi:hypothetical protein|nr:hypothetical protein [Tepidisphaeraceae bacterium]
MIYVPVSDLSSAELAMLGNNFSTKRPHARRYPNERQNRRVLSAVNRSLASLAERVDRLHPAPARNRVAPHALAS